MTQNSRLEIGPFSRLEKSDGRFAVAEDSHNWSLCETKCKKWDKFFRNFFHCLCLNGTGANPNSESATAKRSLTILPQSAIPGLVKPNSESPLSLTLTCLPNISSQSMCFSIVSQTAAYCVTQPQYAKYVPLSLKETSGQGVKYLRRQIENAHLWLVQRRTSLGATWLSRSPGSPLLRSTDGWKSLSRSTWRVNKVWRR